MSYETLEGQPLNYRQLLAGLATAPGAPLFALLCYVTSAASSTQINHSLTEQEDLFFSGGREMYIRTQVKHTVRTAETGCTVRDLSVTIGGQCRVIQLTLVLRSLHWSHALVAHFGPAWELPLRG
jgi:hypothetical protein